MANDRDVWDKNEEITQEKERLLKRVEDGEEVGI